MSGRYLLQHARRLEPGCFAAVMATGIASVDAAQHGLVWIARALLVVNIGVFGWLVALSLLRLARFRRRMFADLADARRGAGYLTFVAGAGVLGSQCLMVIEAPRAAWLLWVLAFLAWIALSQAFFAVMITRRHKPPFAAGIGGGWLVLVVSTEAVAVLGNLLAMRGGPATEWLAVVALCAWLVGLAFYIWIGTLVVQRLVFHPLDPAELRAPYWIAMGALAIVTLAGALIMQRPPAGNLSAVFPFVTGFTLLAWALASWWIPLLVILGFWRHVLRRLPLRYTADDWNMAFPVGMYTVGTFELANALELGFMHRISALGVYLNLLVWGTIAAGAVVHHARAFHLHRGGATPRGG
ncbi:MAG: tellurite resistance/C4-dicarboxylate transporter family protein [Xanthomonadales bacterium]|nr:tellurite resistance/C4-dicarboxylate transporter family protein [Xanthomonadales bacterium]